MMCWIPEEIKALERIWDPYRIQIIEKKFSEVPKEALEAYEKCRKWAWEQDQ